MRAIVLTTPGGPEVLRVTEVPTPQPGPGEIRVRVRASSLNYHDYLVVNDDLDRAYDRLRSVVLAESARRVRKALLAESLLRHGRVSLPWVPSWGVRFDVGVDGMSVMMVLLTTFIMPLAVLGGWTSVSPMALGSRHPRGVAAGRRRPTPWRRRSCPTPTRRTTR